MTMPVYPAPELISGAYAMRMELWRADRYGRKLERLSDRRPVSGSISFNEDNEFKRQLSLTIEDPGALRPFQDFVIPTIALAKPFGAVEERNLGHFLITPPAQSVATGRRTGQIEARDSTILLARRQVGDFTRPAGADVGRVAYDLALTAGFLPEQLDIPVDTGVALDQDYRPSPGAVVLVEVNTLLNAGNCYTVWGTGNGLVKSARYQDPSRGVANRRYSTESGLEIVPPITETPSWDSLRNAVTVRNLRPGQPPIWWTARITNRNHPLYFDPDDSSVGFGKEWSGPPVDNSQIPDEAAAKALAESLLAAGASYYRKLAVTTVVDIDAGGHDLIELDIRNGREVLYDGLWRRRTWRIALQGISATTESDLYRSEDWQ